LLNVAVTFSETTPTHANTARKSEDYDKNNDLGIHYAKDPKASKRYFVFSHDSKFMTVCKPPDQFNSLCSAQLANKSKVFDDLELLQQAELNVTTLTLTPDCPSQPKLVRFKKFLIFSVGLPFDSKALTKIKDLALKIISQLMLLRLTTVSKSSRFKEMHLAFPFSVPRAKETAHCVMYDEEQHEKLSYKITIFLAATIYIKCTKQIYFSQTHSRKKLRKKEEA